MVSQKQWQQPKVYQIRVQETHISAFSCKVATSLSLLECMSSFVLNHQAIGESV